MRIDNKKGRKLMELMRQNPGVSTYQLARMAGTSVSYTAKVRRKYREIISVPQPVEKDVTPEALDVVLETASVMASDEGIDKVLTERGLRYGTFLKRAIIAQRLKAVMNDTPNWIALNDDMVEALEMIAHKISRILGGDPAYADSWVDIAGYAQLVADRLNGKER